MKKYLILLVIVLMSVFVYGQSFEIESKSKIEQLFTVEEMDSIKSKVNELILTNKSDTIYYDYSLLTTIIIYQKKLVKKEDEK